MIKTAGPIEKKLVYHDVHVDFSEDQLCATGGERAGVTTEMADRLRALERENQELKQANEIQRKAFVYFALAELDRKSQFLPIKYTERLAETGIAPSVGSAGNSYDNALAETINGLLKAEVVHRRGPWRSFDAVEYATLEWADWFNNRRLLEPVDNIPPAEAEANFYAALGTQTMAA